MKPYLSLAELSREIPFSEQAIRALMHRGELRDGEHYFRRGRRLVFKWAAIEAWIEGRIVGADIDLGDLVPLHRAGGSR